MKILTKKKHDKILKLLAANEIIARKGLKPKDLDCFIDNSANAIYDIGGIKGLQKVINTVENWVKEEDRNDNRCGKSNSDYYPRQGRDIHI